MGAAISQMRGLEKDCGLIFHGFLEKTAFIAAMGWWNCGHKNNHGVWEETG